MSGSPVASGPPYQRETNVLKNRPIRPDDRVGKVFCVVGQNIRRCLICEKLFACQTAAAHAETACHQSQRSFHHGGNPAMQIGEPIRRIVVEPLAPPVNEPQKEPEPISPQPDTEGEPAPK